MTERAANDARPTERDRPHGEAEPTESMRRADRANGEPDALDDAGPDGDQRHAAGEEQAAYNREVDPPA